jgi:hypothetical protein
MVVFFGGDFCRSNVSMSGGFVVGDRRLLASVPRQTKPHPLHVDVHHLVISLHGLLEERRRHLFDSRVVEGEVEPAKLFQRALDKFLDLRVLSHIGRHEYGR